METGHTKMFPRNVCIHEGDELRGSKFAGEWLCVPKEDFESAVNSHSSLVKQRDELLEAAKIMVEHYCDLINSGDAGNWNPEEEDEVIKVRSAISHAEKGS